MSATLRRNATKPTGNSIIRIGVLEQLWKPSSHDGLNPEFHLSLSTGALTYAFGPITTIRDSLLRRRGVDFSLRSFIFWTSPPPHIWFAVPCF
jgi:hypothetical protein